MADLRIEKVVVTGGRKFTDGRRIEADLRALLSLGLRRVAQGGNGIDEQFGGGEVPTNPRSADTLAWLAGAELQLEVSSFAVATYRVNRDPDARGAWNGRDGQHKGAPLNRNIRMLEAERPDLVLAYPDPDSRGTWHCCGAALQRGFAVALWAADCLENIGPSSQPAPRLRALAQAIAVLSPEDRGISRIDCPRFILLPPWSQLDALAVAEALDATRPVAGLQDQPFDLDEDEEPFYDPGGDHGAECDCYVCKDRQQREELMFNKEGA